VAANLATSGLRRRVVEARALLRLAGRWEPAVDPEVYTMRPDGQRVRQLTANDGSFDGFPDWSPDSRTIAFATDRDGDDEVYTMRADGSRQVNRTRHPAFDLQPDWQALPERHH
jgi:Tol biopolymer transport system component